MSLLRLQTVTSVFKFQGQAASQILESITAADGQTRSIWLQVDLFLTQQTLEGWLLRDVTRAQCIRFFELGCNQSSIQTTFRTPKSRSKGVNQTWNSSQSFQADQREKHIHLPKRAVAALSNLAACGQKKNWTKSWPRGNHEMQMFP